ncbi:MAG: hypothetical protein H0X27_04670 [Caulobacteraceae bacterium]|nr:hypothetical protein [Caulobacteraceae bacterium]
MARPSPPAASGGQAINAATSTANAARKLAAATLASAVITASGRPHAVGEAMAIYQDFFHALFPNQGSSLYEAWKKDASRLTTVHN